MDMKEYPMLDIHNHEHLRAQGTELTWREWDAVYYQELGVYILDPDGFPRNSPERMENEKYTEDEFKKRLAFCTVGRKAERLPWEK
jgi:hypothetical protein